MLGLILTGCSFSKAKTGNTASAWMLYNVARAKVISADGYREKMNMGGVVSSPGRPNDIYATSTETIVNNPTDTSMEMSFESTTTARNLNNHTTMYYKNGVKYTNDENRKIKTAIDITKIDDFPYIPAFSRTAIIYTDITKAPTGTTIIFVVKGDGYSGYDQNLSEIPNVEDATFPNATITAFITSDGQLKNVSIKASCSAKINNRRVNATINTKITGIEIGHQTIVFPPDLDSYKEVPAAKTP